MEYYRAEKVNRNLTCIRSLTGELMYLLEGEAGCILIDSCVGIGHLRKYVKTLTDKPVTLLLTHGHVDHAMGAPDFENVYLNHRDIGLYQRQCTYAERKGYVQALLGKQALEWGDEDYTGSAPGFSFRELTDGTVLECEPYHVECYAFPGHTPGSTVFLIREMKILVLGDACNNSTFLFDGDSLPLSDYQKALTENRVRLKGKYERVFLSHHVMETDKDIMDHVNAVCDDILAGRADDLPFEFMGMRAYIAKRCSEHFERADGKSGNIIYSKNKL